MIDENTVRCILDDWKSRKYTHKDIQEKYDLTDEQESAITMVSSRLSLSNIVSRLPKVKEKMKSYDLEKIMGAKWGDVSNE